MTETVIANRTPNADAFKRAIAQYAREAARHATERGSGRYVRQHTTALELLATYVEGLDVDASELGSLWDSQAQHETGSTGKYVPGPIAARVIGGVGLSAVGPIPQPEELLAEIVRGAQADLVKTMNARIAKVSADANSRAHQGAQAKIAEAVEHAQRQQSRAESRVRQLEAELAEAHNKIKFLEPHAPGGDDAPEPEPASKPEPKERERRKSVERGIYATEKADGSIAYEVKIGKSPWQTVGPDLGEARDVRDRLLLKSAKAVA